MNEFFTILVIFVHFISHTKPENILGCGGFVKSHVPIDFSRVEVKLLTKQGILKDKINCAPNNGYYFVPLYDKGEYILELEPPAGWSFTPTKVDLLVDGVSDLCSQGKDINFSFKGFGITGKVESSGSDVGPEGIEVELESNSERRKTITSKGGNFFFTPVYPGDYVVRILNSKWKVWKDSVKVVVAEGNTELSPKSLIIQGFDVSGFVKDEGEPIKDTTIVLFAHETGDHKVDGCDKTPLPDLKSPNKPICHVKTNEHGVFKFGVVPHGRYFVSLYYNERNIYYQPNRIEFNVDHDSVSLKEGFEIIGFNINGRVLKSTNGKPLSKAKVFLNGKEITQTNSDGVYKLERIKAGVYNIQTASDGFLFKEVAIKINPNTKIPDLVPVSYQVCGTVVSDKSQTITFSHVSQGRVVTTISDSNSGQFCEFLNPGKYHVQVVVDNVDSQKGLQFFPKVQSIDVNSEQTGAITFSQLKATVSGKVQCLRKEDCTGLSVILKPSGDLTGDKNNIIIGVSDNSYTISDIYPGLYDITLSDNRLCWKVNKQIVNVNNIKVEIPTFVQTGYAVHFVSSHDTQLLHKIPNQTKENSIKIDKGKVTQCLEKAGSYVFQLNSCHTYDSNTVTYNTDSTENEIFLNALKHTITLTIESESKQKDVSATINIDGVKTQTGPLPYIQNGYQIRLSLSPSETAVIVPHSDVLYFTPPILSINGNSDCEDLGSRFTAVLGVVFQGKIKPPLSGVLVTVETENFDTLMAETDDNGVYKFPPLDKSKSYKIAAKKDSYVLVGPDNDGNFLAHKLAEIVIEVLDKNTKIPLQGTLLSLSGGDSYRSNLQTNENGRITFHSLSPGEYFLRPMMKEYSFEPSSKIVTVNEGETVTVQLTGKRVAYSAYGSVTSLNREPEENVVVMATGIGNCSHFSEESTSEVNGQFRIRGLQPYCSYDIKVKNILDSRFSIERSAPKFIHVEKVTADITGLQLVIFRPLTHMDLLVKVYAKNPDHYKTLRLKVICETSSSNVMYTGRVDTSLISLTADNNQGVLIQIPPLPLDGKTYSVHLESNLNNKLEPEPELFVANSSFKYVELDFIVKSNLGEQDIKQTSVWTLALIFAIMFAVYNIDKVSQFLRDMLGGYVADLLNSVSKKNSSNEYNVDNVDIDQIVQSINAVKRKPKPKKVL